MGLAFPIDIVVDVIVVVDVTVAVDVTVVISGVTIVLEFVNESVDRKR